MKWPIAKINIAKDFLGGLVFLIFLSVTLFIITPGIQNSRIESLRTAYMEEQRAQVEMAVKDAGRDARFLYDLLRQKGLSDHESRQIVLERLAKKKYGVHEFGYFYVVDSQLTLIMHPYSPEIVGKKLADIRSPDGRIMGDVFSLLAQGVDHGFIKYRWWVPGKTNTSDDKNAYFETDGRLGWTIVSGFYTSDFNAMLDSFSQASHRAISDTQVFTLLLAALYFILIISLSAYIFHRIGLMERALSNQIRTLDQYKLILDESSIVSRTNPAGVITYVNDKFTQVTGYTAAQALGHKHNLERHPDTPMEVFKEMWTQISGGKTWSGILKNRKADGTSYYKKATIVPIMGEGRKVVEYLSSGQDVTQIIESRDRIERAFFNDPLTGLGNRLRLFGEMNHPQDQSLILIDVENFSGINRTLGTQGGDQFLKSLGSLLYELGIGHGYRTFRIEADTFCFLGDADESGFDQFLAQLERSLTGQWIQLNNESLPLVVHLGAAFRVDNAYLCAEEALKIAQGEKKLLHRHQPDHPAPGSELMASLEVLHRLHDAYENNRVMPIFQPIVDLKAGTVNKFECLIRAYDGLGQVILPSQFIPISKKTNFYRFLTLRMVQRVCEALRGNQFEFSLNLTVEDLMNDETISFLLEKVEAEGTVSRLIIEVVESEELKDFDKANRNLQRMKDSGIRLAIDDFGSGYSNFDYLLRLSPSFVKIDGSITTKLLEDERARQLVASIVKFASSSGIKTVAEHIDSKELQTMVESLGVDFGQGWLFGAGGKSPQ